MTLTTWPALRSDAQPTPVATDDAALDRLERTLDRLDKNLDRLEESLDRVERNIDRVSRRVELAQIAAR